jgi:hypothetical protein
MNINEFSRQQGRVRKSSAHEEHKIQAASIRWFKYMYPSYAGLIFAIPNAARRSARQGAWMKEEGMLAGVADVFIDVPNKFYHGLRIEFKTKKGHQSEAQKKFQFECEKVGYKYLICRSLDYFVSQINLYLQDV